MLMGERCGSGHSGDTESDEDPGANRVPHGREEAKEWEKSGRLNRIKIESEVPT